MSGYVEVVGWQDFQHYKDRDPPWIKLHRTLLTNYQWYQLTDQDRAHLVGLWLLAARHHNAIPHDLDYIAHQIHATSPMRIHVLVESGFIRIVGQVASIVPAEVEHCAMLEERRGETEGETEGENNNSGAADAARLEATPMQQVLGCLRRIAYAPDGVPPDGWTIARDGTIAKRLMGTGTSADELCQVIEGVALLRDDGHLDWLPRGQKFTLRAVFRTRAGAVPIHTLALNHLDKQAAAGRPRRQDGPQTRPEAVRDLIAGVVGSLGGSR